MPTLRVNLNYALGVTFAWLRSRLPIYRKMGFTRIYLSCPFHNHPLPDGADRRSAHGYNPFSPEIDPKLGGMTEFRLFCETARDLGMEVCVDVVHHMDPRDNVRYQDVASRPHYFLSEPGENGVCANYAGFDDKMAVQTKHVAACAWLYGRLKSLKDEGLIHGFRVDYAEGLTDWHQFAGWLGKFGLPIWFEHTRELGQKLPMNVVGTTGGDVIAAWFAAGTNGEGLGKIAAYGAKRTGSSLTFQAHMREVAKRCIAQDWCRKHAERLHRLLKQLHGPEVTLEALVEGLLYFPRRTFPNYEVGQASLSTEDHALIKGSPLPEAVQLILQLDLSKSYDPWVELFWRTVADLLCMSFRIAGGEDLRFLAYYEGGCSPDMEPLSPAQLDENIQDRLRLAPLTFITDSTHDTRLGPRQRAMAAAVTHYADLFLHYAESWRHLLADLGTEQVPGAEIEWLAFTTLAVLPVRRQAGGPPTLYNQKDVFEYIVRIAREGGKRTSWLGFNVSWESQLQEWLAAIYSHERFVASLAEFHEQIDQFSETLALAWVLLRLLPGTPAFDEICLTLDVLLADPHCRALADIEAFAARLEAFEAGEAPTRETAYAWMVWQVLKASEGMDLSSYELVSTDGGSFAFRAGNYHVSIPLVPEARLVHPEGDGWRNLTEPLQGISPTIGLFQRV
jgi:maltooligosyltrehalose synthase